MLSLGERIVIQMKKEGRAEEKMQIAKEMLKKSIPIKIIGEVTRLEEEKIEKIKAELASV